MTDEVSFSFQFADLLRACQSVHDRHFLIHENDTELDRLGALVVLVPVCRFSKVIKRLAPVICDVYNAAKILELLLQYTLVYPVAVLALKCEIDRGADEQVVLHHKDVHDRFAAVRSSDWLR